MSASGGGGREIGIRCAALNAAARLLQGSATTDRVDDTQLGLRAEALAARLALYLRTGRSSDSADR